MAAWVSSYGGGCSRDVVGCASVRSLLALPELCVEEPAEEGDTLGPSHASALKCGLRIGKLLDAEPCEQTEGSV